MMEREGLCLQHIPLDTGEVGSRREDVSDLVGVGSLVLVRIQSRAGKHDVVHDTCCNVRQRRQEPLRRGKLERLAQFPRGLCNLPKQAERSCPLHFVLNVLARFSPLRLQSDKHVEQFDSVGEVLWLINHEPLYRFVAEQHPCMAEDGDSSFMLERE